MHKSLYLCGSERYAPCERGIDERRCGWGAHGSGDGGERERARRALWPGSALPLESGERESGRVWRAQKEPFAFSGEPGESGAALHTGVLSSCYLPGCTTVYMTVNETILAYYQIPYLIL